jgi:hypothetical protein
MLEIIRVIAETIPESLSIESPLKARKGNGREDVGTDLYLLYSALNNILVTGRNIVWELEHSLDWLDRKATDSLLKNGIRRPEAERTAPKQGAKTKTYAENTTSLSDAASGPCSRPKPGGRFSTGC